MKVNKGGLRNFYNLIMSEEKIDKEFLEWFLCSPIHIKIMFLICCMVMLLSSIFVFIFSLNLILDLLLNRVVYICIL